jgi:hypothetical protein
MMHHVRDARSEEQPIKGKGGEVIEYQTVRVDPGIEDKRLLIYEPEWAKCLRVMNREGNTLSAVIRQAWENGNLGTLTKSNATTATRAHISIIGHITPHELLANLNRVDMANGFANRFLFFLVKRSKYLPEPTGVPPRELERLIADLRGAVAKARELSEIPHDDVAREAWAEVYRTL